MLGVDNESCAIGKSDETNPRIGKGVELESGKTDE